ncbi:hypothetical protein [Kordia jejudonensis]|uniref:hypothetical protein n=1 Tax=Kordia jejudonensis TaxID=1348245 RepID=UPI000629C68D|nr:hypothetical protein [Kordia jejudonensis]
MKLNCKKCGNEIYLLHLTEEQKFEIWGMVKQDLKLFAIKKIVDDFGLSHKEAKIIVSHINPDYGTCNRCENDELDSENIECIKCGAFNFNFKEPVFNSEFCSHLEYKLDFDSLGMENVVGYWCDGVDCYPYDLKSLSKERIKKDKMIVTRAWIGKGGQGIYEMNIKFGKQSINNYINGLSLIDCIPDGAHKTWIKIEPEKNKIQISLK